MVVKVVQNHYTNGKRIGIDFIAQKGVSFSLCHWGRIRWSGGVDDAQLKGLMMINKKRR